jgi:hypothetical protein
MTKFLILRFAPGAAGNLVSSILQCSPEVAHWDPTQELQKSNNNWLDYFKKIFPTDISQWIYHEPIGQLNWGTREIFSAKYERGNNLTQTEFENLEIIHCTKYYHEQKKLDRYLPIFWHKEHMPSYFANSRAITVHLDSKSLRWFDHAVYKKHYRIIKNTSDCITVQRLENRPEIVIKQFQGQVEFESQWPSFRSFVKECILENPFRLQYSQTERMPLWPIPCQTISLSNILTTSTFYACYLNLCQFLEITPVLSIQSLSEIHSYWRQIHEF